MCDEKLIHKLINMAKKMPLRQMMEERQAIINQCPYYKNKLNHIRPEQQIYRIEPFVRFTDNISNKRLSFTLPKVWQDTFDGAFVRTPVYFEQGKVSANHAYRQDYFCQCWSYEELESMWKLLSPNPYETVMIVSTVDKIMRQIWTDESCGKYVGIVEYQPVENMRKESFFQSEFKASCYVFNEIGMAKTFLFKPDSLSYEKEIRFITRMKAEQEQQKERIMVCISSQPIDYIDKILVDPRASETFESEVRGALSQYGLIVERSNKNKKTIEDTDINEVYQPSKNNYGLPRRYVFSE